MELYQTRWVAPPWSWLGWRFFPVRREFCSSLTPNAAPWGGGWGWGGHLIVKVSNLFNPFDIMKNENQLNFTSYLVNPQVNLSHKVWKIDSWSILSHLTGEFICSSFGVSGKNWFTDVKVKSPKLFGLVCLAQDVPYQMSCKCPCSLFLYEIHFQGLCDIGERPDKRQRALKRQTFRSSQKNCQKPATSRAESKMIQRAFGLSCYRPTCTQYRQRGVMWQSTDQIFFL